MATKKDQSTGISVQDVKHVIWFGQRSMFFETHDADGNVTSTETADEWRQRIISELCDPKAMINLGISKIYLIFHDQDEDEHGNKRELHCHFVVWFTNGDIWERIHKKLGCSDRPENCEPPSDPVDALRYLIHVSKAALNSENKHIYGVDEVIAVSADPDKPIEPYRKAIVESARKQAAQKRISEQAKIEKRKIAVSEIEEQAATGKIDEKGARRIFARDSLGVGFHLSDWYTYKSKIIEAIKEYQSDLLTAYKLNHRCLTTIYINGDGSSGKTDLAFEIAKSCYPGRNIHTVAPKGKNTTYDFAGHYKGEPASILSEFTADFSVPQFLDAFDPIRPNDVNSRNDDKPWYAELALLPTASDIEQTIYKMWSEYAVDELKKLGVILPYTPKKETALQNLERANSDITDKIRQIRRRIPIVVDIGKGSATIRYLDYSKNDNHIHIYDKDIIPSPYLHYDTVIYDSNNATDIDRLVAKIKAAVLHYYDYNKHSVNPSSTPRPTITI